MKKITKKIKRYLKAIELPETYIQKIEKALGFGYKLFPQGKGEFFINNKLSKEGELIFDEIEIISDKYCFSIRNWQTFYCKI